MAISHALAADTQMVHVFLREDVAGGLRDFVGFRYQPQQGVGVEKNFARRCRTTLAL